jgi:hypothetical protein
LKCICTFKHDCVGKPLYNILGVDYFQVYNVIEARKYLKDVRWHLDHIQRHRNNHLQGLESAPELAKRKTEQNIANEENIEEAPRRGVNRTS